MTGASLPLIAPSPAIAEATKLFFVALAARARGRHWTAKRHCDRLLEVAGHLPAFEDQLVRHAAARAAAGGRSMIRAEYFCRLDGARLMPRLRWFDLTNVQPWGTA